MADFVNLDDSVSVSDTEALSVEVVIADSATAADTLDFVFRILHLAKRVFTLRLRK